MFFLFYGFLNGVLICEHLLVQRLGSILRVLRIELPLLADHLESPVHITKLKVGACVRTDVPILVDSRTQYYSLVKKIGDLLVSH